MFKISFESTLTTLKYLFSLLLIHIHGTFQEMYGNFPKITYNVVLQANALVGHKCGEEIAKINKVHWNQKSVIVHLKMCRKCYTIWI